MNGIWKAAQKMPLRAAAAFAAALVALTFVPVAARAADNPLKLTVIQAFTAYSPSAAATFSYRLRPLEAGSPMPADSPAEYIFTATGNSRAQLGPLAFAEQGLYRYELSQVVAAEMPGFTYDRRVYTVEAYVDAALRVELVVKNEDGTKAAEIEFRNSYGVSPPPPTAPPTTKPGSDGPKMGDDADAALAVALFVFGGVLVAGAMTALFAGRKRRRQGDV